MKGNHVTRSLNALGLVVLIGAPALIHIALFHSQSHALPLALLLLQLGGFWVVVGARVRGRGKWLLGAALGGLAGLLAWAFGAQAAVVSAGLAHAAIHIALLTLFARTLIQGREPLITGIVRRIRGPLPPEIDRYSRQVTVLWCAYFTAQLLASLLLLCAAPLAAWSFFINVLSFPLTVTVFVGEFIFHTIRFRHLPQRHFVELVKAITAWRMTAPEKTQTG
jgi:uncharacterized membrane protein